MSYTRIGSRTNERIIKRKDGGRKKKTKEYTDGVMFGEDHAVEIKL
jgi:hypothetical protein